MAGSEAVYSQMEDYEIQDGILIHFRGVRSAVHPSAETPSVEFPDHYLVTYAAIPDEVTAIGEGAFSSCNWLRHVDIPDTVTSIGARAFNGCTGLTSVTIPDSVTAIGESAFQYCTALRSVTIPGSVTSIGRLAFEDCRELPSVKIPDSVTCIGEHAFYNCRELALVTVRGIRLNHDRLLSLSRNAHASPDDIIRLLVNYENDCKGEADAFSFLRMFSDPSPFTAEPYPIAGEAFAVCPEDARNNAYIRTHLEKIVCCFCDRRDTAALEKLLKSSLFEEPLRGCIDSCIDYAITQEKPEIVLMLTNYKAEKIGFTDAMDHLTL